MSITELPPEALEQEDLDEQMLGDPQVEAPAVTSTVDKAPEAPALWETPVGRGILAIVENFERGQEQVRHLNVMKARKHIHYWNNNQYLFESLIAKDWMTVDDLRDDPDSDIDPALYAKIINVYKPNGEIIIGAITPNVPTVRYFPKDADDPDDVTTSKAYSKMTELIQRQNKAQMLLMKAVYVMYNQGMVAAYNESKTDSRFGTVQQDIYEDITVLDVDHYCPQCGYSMGQETIMQDEPPQQQEIACPECGFQGPAEQEGQPREDKQYKETVDRPKPRECIEIYGLLNVKIPMWCRDQESVGVLILETEESVFTMRTIYPEFEAKISGQAYPDTWERSARVPTNYRDNFPSDMCTVRRVWLRPTEYRYYMSGTEEFKALMEYPDGLYAVIVNDDLLVEIVEDKLDEHWTIVVHPTAETLHVEPLGTSMVPLQDITNEQANITLETMEYGISEVFADSRVVDFDEYEGREAKPGQITAVTAPSGMALGNAFHEVKPATMPEGIEMFAERIEKVTQFVMGTYPSVFGGSLSEGGGTAKEYEMSRSSALQRLSTIWNILQYWWADVMGKSTKSFAEHMIEDEKFVKKQGTNFLNIWIRKIELQGNIGDILPEVSETLPISWTQKRDILFRLMDMKDPMIGGVLSHPENASLVASLIGVPELYIPGDDDRNKQLREIAIMITQAPIMPPPPMPGQDMMGPPPKPMSSVPVTPELDNHPVEAEVCRSWLKSEVGQEMKTQNPPAYLNVLAHLGEHLMFAQPAPMPGGPGGPGGKPDELGPPDHIGEVNNKGVEKE